MAGKVVGLVFETISKLENYFLMTVTQILGHSVTFLERNYICLFSHFVGFINVQIQRTKFYGKSSILIRPTPAQYDPSFWWIPRMVVVILSTLLY